MCLEKHIGNVINSVGLKWMSVFLQPARCRSLLHTTSERMPKLSKNSDPSMSCHILTCMLCWPPCASVGQRNHYECILTKLVPHDSTLRKSCKD